MSEGVFFYIFSLECIALLYMDLTALYDIFLKNPTVCTDTRSIQQGCLFFALSGTNFDGNQFAAEALEKGAAYAVVSDAALIGSNLIYVENTLATLQSLANYHRRHFNIPIIAITGSNGKTTTKELVTTALSLKYKVHATVGNFNNHIGVPVTLLRMQPDTDIGVIEMGANHIGEIKALCAIAMPTHGLITNIGKAHLEGFGSMEGVRKAKGELFEYLKENNGYAFVNADDPSVAELGNNFLEKTTYGINEDGHPDMLFNYTSNPDHDGFTIESGHEPIVIHSSMFGHYNATNIIAAITVGRHFDVGIKELTECLSAFVPGANRSEVVTHAGCTIIKDAYNANPSSMELALHAFAERFNNGWVVLGAMKELGAESENAHRRIIEVLQTSGLTHIYLIGEEFRTILNKLDPSGHLSITTADNIEELKKSWNWDMCRGNAVLLKGSRSMHLEKLLED